MALVNGLEDYMRWVNDAAAQDGIDIDTELVENCGHGKHKKFYQGTLTLKDFYDKTKITNYFVVGYQNEITQEQIDGMLTKSSVLRGGNNKNNHNGVEDQGCGTKIVFIQRGDRTFISTRNTQELSSKTKFLAKKWDSKKQYVSFNKKMSSGENKDGACGFNVNQEARKHISEFE